MAEALLQFAALATWTVLPEVCRAPVPTATPPPTSARVNPAAVTVRIDSVGRS